MDAWIAGRVMGQGRQRLAIRLRNVLSRDSATWRADERTYLTHRIIELGRRLHTPAPLDASFLARQRDMMSQNVATV
jgi:hypothetical protein